MPYKMGSCKGCKARREALAKVANTAKQYVSEKVAAATKSRKTK